MVKHFLEVVGSPSDVKLPQHLVRLATLTGITPFDRFGYAETVPGAVLHPRAEYRFGGRSLDSYGNIAMDRARELLALDVPLYVYWSGGIDSTAILVALIRAGATREQLTVVCDNDSEMENGPFYDNHIDGVFPTRHAVDVPRMLVEHPEAHIVTGELNDQLFGADTMQRVCLTSGAPALQRPNTDADFVDVMGRLGYAAPDASALRRDIVGSAQTQDVTLRNVFDLLWWLNFAFKWQDVALRTMMAGRAAHLEHMNARQAERVHHFFGTARFQDWSITRHELKIIDRWPTYKITAKRFIFRHDANEDYLAHAVKVGSLGELLKRGGLQQPGNRRMLTTGCVRFL